MLFDGADCTLCCIESVDMWRHELVGATISLDGSMVGSAGFIVKDVVLDSDVGSAKAGGNGGVGSNVVGVSFESKGLDKDGI